MLEMFGEIGVVYGTIVLTILVIVCGEILPNVLAKTLKSNYPDSKIYNTYGPTEATVATTLVEITEEIIEKSF